VREQVWDAKKPGTFSGFPMAILVNRFSASASEIVSACLQDHKRAVVIGERTWGKGSVQNVIELEEQKSALKLTTASYHRPSGKNIHRFPNSKETDEWGVVPDAGYEVKLNREGIIDYQEYREQRDILSDKDRRYRIRRSASRQGDRVPQRANGGGSPAKAEKPKAAEKTDDKAAAAPQTTPPKSSERKPKRCASPLFMTAPNDSSGRRLLLAIESSCDETRPPSSTVG